MSVNKLDYNSPEVKRSRKAYMAQCTFEYFIALLVADAFLAKLLLSLGLSDAAVGIVSSFISVAFIVQLASIPLMKAKMSTKKMVIIFDTISQLFFMLMYFIPFLPLDAMSKKVLVVCSILIAYVAKYLILSICFKWANSYVEPTKRAVYSAKKEMLSLALGIIFTMVIGWIIDKYESIGNLNGGFLFIGATMFVINVCNFVSLLMIKRESENEQEASGQPWSEVKKQTLGNKSFCWVLIFETLVKCATYFTVGFLGSFKTKDLVYTVFAVQVINMVSNGCRVLVSVPFGKYSDKRSFAKGYELALIISFLSYICLIFTTKETSFLIIIYSILYNVSIAGTNQNSFNIVYSYVDSNYISQAMAIKNCVGGVFGFGASLLGGKILSIVQANGNQFLGISMYGQQLLAGISAVFILAAVLVVHFVLGKKQVKVQ